MERIAVNLQIKRQYKKKRKRARLVILTHITCLLSSDKMCQHMYAP